MGPHVSPWSIKRLPGAEGPPEGNVRRLRRSSSEYSRANCYIQVTPGGFGFLIEEDEVRVTRSASKVLP